MHDRLDVLFRIATNGQQTRDLLEIGDGIEIARRLFASKAAVKVCPKSSMPGIAGQLTNIINMIDHAVQRDEFVAADAGDPRRLEHPGVKCRTNHGLSLNQCPQLAIAELALVWHQRTAIIVAGQDRATITVERLPERLIR